MPTKKFISIEFVQFLAKQRAAINSFDLNDIVWLENGSEVKVLKDVINQFEMTGLNNCDFITSGFYKMENVCKIGSKFPK